MDNKERFLEIYKSKITREGADKLLDYLLSSSSDFFTAPASARFHGAYSGGLLEHSLNVYDCLCDYLSRDRVKNEYGMNYSEESIAIVSLLHDLCKIDCYKEGTRNVKGPDGVWKTVPTYEFSDNLPYGHGEKSVFLIERFMRLKVDEAIAIRWHMGGFDDAARGGSFSINNAFEKYPILVKLHIADIEATYLMENTPH